MEKNKHTPGPWKATAKEGNHIIHSNTESNCLAIVGTGIFNSDPLRWEEARANAALIAAAPDLLEALQELHAMYEKMTKNFVVRVGWDVAAKAKKALAKATTQQ